MTDGFTFEGYASTRDILTAFQQFFGVKRLALYRVSSKDLYRRCKAPITITVIASRRLWSVTLSDVGGGYTEATVH